MAVPAFEQYSPFIAAASKRFGVPEHLIRGAMALENYGGDPNLPGGAGELGLMQIMPRTFDELAARHNLPLNRADPETNILAGTAYLREMSDRFGGDPAWTLAAYNAGPGGAAKAGGDFTKLPAVTQAHLRRAAEFGIIDGANLPPREVSARPAPVALPSSTTTQQGANAMGAAVPPMPPGLLSPPAEEPPLGGLLGNGDVWQLLLMAAGSGLMQGRGLSDGLAKAGANIPAMLMQARQMQMMQRRQAKADARDDREFSLRESEAARKQQAQQQAMQAATAYADRLEKAGQADLAAAVRANPTVMDQIVGQQAKRAFPESEGGPFRGNAIEAQSMNMLLTGDPASPEYALAHQHMTQPRPVLAQDPNDPARTITVMVTPQLPPNIRPPAYATAPGQGGGLPAPALAAQGTPAPQAGSQPPAPRFTAEPVMGTGREQAPTEGQARAASFGTRMTEAEQRLDSVFAKGFEPTAVGEQVANLPGVGNVLASKDYQLYRQAAGDWIRAKLRKESGAVIGVEEEAQEFRTYFPQFGDSAEVIEQKRRARDTARNAILGEAGSHRPSASGGGVPAPPPGFQVVR